MVADAAKATVGPLPAGPLPAGPVPAGPAAPFGEAIEDDGAVELAMMATSHPEIQRFGKLVLENASAANRLSTRCTAWLKAGSFPDEALDDYLAVQAAAGTLHKEVERLDSIDLDDLRKDWGDKATVRMSRKTLIGFCEQVMTRLEGIQGRMAGPAATLKEQRRERAARRQGAPAEEQSLQEKYGERLQGKDTSRERLSSGAAAGARPEGPAAKRQRLTSADEVRALLEKLRTRIGQQLERRTVQAFRRQLTNLVAFPDFAKSPALCREGVESALGAVQAALDVRPSSEVLAECLLALQSVEGLQEPSGLPSVLLDLARALEGL